MPRFADLAQRSVITSLAFLALALSGSGLNPARADDLKDVGISEKLKSAVINSQKELGAIEPWQKKIFDEEIVPQFQRFIKNYRAENSGVTVDVDLDNIRNYLMFYGPKALKRDNFRVLVAANADPSCAKCTEASTDVKRLLKSRLERRGLVPIFTAPEEISPKLTGKVLEEKVSDIAEQKNFAGSMVVQWQVAPVDNIDTAHADEKHYLIKSVLQFKDFGRSEGKLEIMDTDVFETSEARLLTDAFTEMGAKLAKNQIMAQEGAKDELALQVVGIKTSADLERLRTHLAAKLTSTLMEDRKISRGQITFAIHTSKTPDQLKPILSGLKIEPGILAWLDSDSQTIRMEIK